MALSIIQSESAIDTSGGMTVTLGSAGTNGNYLLVLYGAVGGGQSQHLGGSWIDIFDTDCAASEAGSWAYAAYRPISAGENSVTLTGITGTEGQYAALFEIHASTLNSIWAPESIVNILSGTGTTIALGSVNALTNDIVFAMGLFHDDDCSSFSFSNSYGSGPAYRETATPTPQLAAQAAYLAIGSNGSQSTTITPAGPPGADQRHGFMITIREGFAPPVITDVETDEDFRHGDTGVTITGNFFESTQGAGKVEIGDSATYASAHPVAQTVTSWADTAIDFTANLGTLTPGPLYLYVTNDRGDRNATAFPITVHRAIAFTLSPSANIAASGENTTAQLTAPAGKTTSNFGGGRIQDDENPGDAVDIGADQYREDEWSIVATTGAIASATYEFRVVLSDGTLLTTYSVTPTATVTGGAVQVDLTGNQPAATGALAVKYQKALTGNQPAPTGALSQKYKEALAGNQPAATGALTQKYKVALAGDQPAPSGAPTETYKIALAGNQPAASGALSPKQTLHVSIAGDQPAPTGALTEKYQISLAGDQPAPTGALANLRRYFIALAGDQPAPTGSLALKYQIAITGSQPTATGALSVKQTLYVSLAGDQPSATSALVQAYRVSLAGSQPTATGALAVLYRITLAGDQPTATGTAATRYRIALAGSQPTATGALAVLYRISLAGEQEAPDGDLSVTSASGASLTGVQPTSTGTLSAKKSLHISVSGSQPAPSGSLATKYLRAIAGDQPTATGTLNVHAIAILAGDQPAPTGTVTVKYRIALAGDQPVVPPAPPLPGNQPAPAGTLGVHAHIGLAGSQPNATGALRTRTFLALVGVQPAPSGDLVGVPVTGLLNGNQPTATGVLVAIVVFIAPTVPDTGCVLWDMVGPFDWPPSGFEPEIVEDPEPSGFIRDLQADGDTLANMF